MLIRDLVNGKSRFQDFLASPERIASNILASRLKRMEAAGLISARLYSERPKRYEYALTPRGAGLLPVLQAMSRWAGAELPDRWVPPERFMKLKPTQVATRS